MVSVIVPVYNVEAYLHRCIDSILAQTYPDFELILVDDGSTDHCSAICDAYAAKDSRIVVIHKENGGVSAARNSALDIAQGDYVAFCDSDDYWSNDLLETALNALEENRADCVAFGIATHDADGAVSYRTLSNERVTFRNDEDNIRYLAGVLLAGRHGWELWSRLFCRDIIERYHIRCCTSCHNYAEDLGFVCQYILHAQCLCSIPDSLYHYTIRDNSMMRTSENRIRLDDLNEVSFCVGHDYYMTIQSNTLRSMFPVLHFMIVNTELRKLYDSRQFDKIPLEAAKIQRRKWWKRNIVRLYFCYGTLVKCFGKHFAWRVLLFNTYLQHGSWRLYAYESGLYYKWYRRQKR